jgi:hypothetical protein
MNDLVGGEERHLDILQNIEFIIHKIHTEHGNITDRNVETALGYFIEMGKAQLDLPAKFLTELPPNTQMIVDAVDDLLSFRDSLTGNQEDFMSKLKCILYRVWDSVKTHYSRQNEHSYLEFVGQFLA